MKLHDNSCFQGCFVVPGADANLMKPNRLIERPCGRIGLPNLEVEGTVSILQNALYESATHASAPEIGSHRQIQQLALVRRHTPRNHEPGHPSALDGDPKIVL